jgi:hypothetical protein
MKVIIAGSRDIQDYTLVEEAVVTSGFEITEVVCGMARGIDLLGKEWAKKNSKLCTEFPARWQQYGNAAGPFRNLEMGKYADALIAIWNQKSVGTKHMISVMQRLIKPYYILTLPRSNHG